jgi:ubiquinone/menaquinone biosynthesis C-methylase UbiE
MLSEIARSVRPSHRILDAGCGTGAMARAVLALEPGAQLTMLDRSPAMLSKAADIPGHRQLGSVLDLPFPEGVFDVVVGAWMLETISERERALGELVRVLAPGGSLLSRSARSRSGHSAAR